MKFLHSLHKMKPMVMKNPFFDKVISALSQAWRFAPSQIFRGLAGHNEARRDTVTHKQKRPASTREPGVLCTTEA